MKKKRRENFISRGLTPVAPRMTILGLGNLNSLLSTPGGGPRPSTDPTRAQNMRKDASDGSIVVLVGSLPHIAQSITKHSGDHVADVLSLLCEFYLDVRCLGIFCFH